MDRLATLARVFAYLSLLTFGGGMAAYPELTAQIVDVHRWLTLSQLDYLYSVGQAAPGPNIMMIVSIGTLRAGLAGAVTVLVAFFAPTALLALVVGRLWQRLQGQPWVALRRGLAPVSIGLLVAGLLTFTKGALIDGRTTLIAVTVFVTLLRTQINPALLVIAGALVGIVVFGHR
jgi:chromate transporter